MKTHLSPYLLLQINLSLESFTPSSQPGWFQDKTTLLLVWVPAPGTGWEGAGAHLAVTKLLSPLGAGCQEPPRVLVEPSRSCILGMQRKTGHSKNPPQNPPKSKIVCCESWRQRGLALAAGSCAGISCSWTFPFSLGNAPGLGTPGAKPCAMQQRTDFSPNVHLRGCSEAGEGTQADSPAPHLSIGTAAAP